MFITVVMVKINEVFNVVMRADVLNILEAKKYFKYMYFKNYVLK